MTGLTKRQQEILSYIQEFIKTHRYSPSFREIRDHFRFRSTGSVAKHIETLKRKGILTNEQHCSRSLFPIIQEQEHSSKAEVALPFIGYISEGAQIETLAQTQILAIPDFLVQSPEKTYLLRARGDTLIGEMIGEGDLLLVEARTEANDGETVVCLVQDRGTLVKKYHPEGNYVRLSSVSPGIEPLILSHEDLLITGVVVGLIRMYQ